MFLRAFARSRKVKGNADGRLVCRPTAIRYYVNKRRLWSILLPYHFSRLSSLLLTLFLSFLLCSAPSSFDAHAVGSVWKLAPFRYFSFETRRIHRHRRALQRPADLFTSRVFLPGHFLLRALWIFDSRLPLQLWKVTTTATTTPTSGRRRKRRRKKRMIVKSFFPFSSFF